MAEIKIGYQDIIRIGDAKGYDFYVPEGDGLALMEERGADVHSRIAAESWIHLGEVAVPHDGAPNNDELTAIEEYDRANDIA